MADPRRSELYQSWKSDLGGDITSAQDAVLRRAAEADAVATTAFDYLANTKEALVSDRPQKAIAAFVRAANLTFKAAGLLGLERQARPIDPLKAVRQAVEEANA